MIIGRKEEIRTLERLYGSPKSEFVAVYGRRRVGKTYLVGQTFRNRITFLHTGLSPIDGNKKNLMYSQLDNFYVSLIKAGMENERRPLSWFEAFLLLEKHLESIDDGSKQLIFIDELPWLDTPKSNFIQALESFWNSWRCFRNNLMLIVSGSSNSWILNNLINNYGGLYNRLTYVMKLTPFTLRECEDYLASLNVRFSRFDIVQSYMVLGGIPFYLAALDPQKSLAQNIDAMFFSRNARFKNEYERLFNSMFANPEKEKSIVRFLSTRDSGYTRKEISKGTGISLGGGLSMSLSALAESGFILKYVPFGLKKTEEHYKLIDPFCIFHLDFLDNRKITDEVFWEKNVTGQSLSTWRGLAFENVCFNHIPQIKKALGISGVQSTESAWSKKKDETEGMQIDLIIVRRDNVVNMCELKFYSSDFTVDGSYYRTILSRADKLSQMLPQKTVVRSTLITTFGLTTNEYSSAFVNTITMDDLFE